MKKAAGAHASGNARKSAVRRGPQPSKKKPARKRAGEPARVPAPTLLYRGKHLQLVSQDGWEACERVKATGVVTIVAVTPDDRLLLTEQFRIPVGKRVIEMPAGLAGDVAGEEHEALAAAARRELLEETGYDADAMEFLTAGPSSAGLTSEVITFFRAVGVRKAGPGGGDGTENIVLHEVPVTKIRAWLRARETAGLLVDPKVYTGLLFLQDR